jgi:hypothetical protein
MRLTIHLDTFDAINPMAFAILWLDKDTRKWSLEGHTGLHLPKSGDLHVDCGNTLICGPHDTSARCVLEGLDLNGPSGPFEAETGRAQWCGDAGRASVTGLWHVQCIDEETALPEHGVFGADENA